jgi:hypothetical protein
MEAKREALYTTDRIPHVESQIRSGLKATAASLFLFPADCGRGASKVSVRQSMMFLSGF